MKAVHLSPGNIWSGAKSGLAVLTNPTELAFRKGNLRRHWPVEWDGKAYPDSEALYQFFSKNCKGDADACYGMCTHAVACKLYQYPVVFESIKISCGVNFLEQCSHFVNGRSPRWEGKGVESGFIRCLITAYKELS